MWCRKPSSPSEKDKTVELVSFKISASINKNLAYKFIFQHKQSVQEKLFGLISIEQSCSRLNNKKTSENDFLCLTNAWNTAEQ